ncbi:hypothetical protein EBO15_28425 [Actinomadura harenae]|uniref:Uncharacterized protein n=1 Tax=Actinomadura harenae TaxID=2483351 RepID=A0A3M2LQX7_9ACTN|nr:hypothetical protein EBO15_28425 [Actinomadura harenae]
MRPCSARTARSSSTSCSDTGSRGHSAALMSFTLSLARPWSSQCVQRPIHVRRARNGNAATSSDAKNPGLMARMRGKATPDQKRVGVEMSAVSAAEATRVVVTVPPAPRVHCRALDRSSSQARIARYPCGPRPSYKTTAAGA